MKMKRYQGPWKQTRSIQKYNITGCVMKKAKNKGSSLAVQWLRLSTFTTVTWVQSLAGDLRSHNPCSSGKKKKKAVLESIRSTHILNQCRFPGGPLSSAPAPHHASPAWQVFPLPGSLSPYFTLKQFQIWGRRFGGRGWQNWSWLWTWALEADGLGFKFWLLHLTLGKLHKLPQS